MTRPAARRDWDAASYERLAAPQERWALEVIERLELRGDETVLDAGCGSGRVTRHLVARLPRGRVVAVDASPAMAGRVRRVLRPRDLALVADLLELELPQPVDAAFSNAAFHWVLDHAALWRRIAAALRPGGRVEAQYGGRGNLAELREACRAVASEPPFACHLKGFAEPWRYAAPGETERWLRAAGFDPARAWLTRAPTRLPPGDAEGFMRTVCLNPYLGALPAGLHDAFVSSVRGRLADPCFLGYVRLNVSAAKAR